MAMSYVNIQDRAEQILQDTTPSTYDTTETGMWIEDSLKELSQYDPHIVEVLFKIESRTGTATSTSSNNLVDATEDQFVATDDDNEKVIHNTTDNTWAVVDTYTDAENLVLTADIMASGENYSIYNKRCRNDKQIFIGDMPVYLWVDSVEYPIGTRRNFTVYDDVVEIDVDTVADSDLTADPLPDIDVLIRFAVPHILSQLTDLAGTLSAATEDKGDTEIAIASMGATEVIGVGEEFHIADHRTLYFVREEDTTSGNAVAALKIFPALEAGTVQNEVITFRKSSLQPQHEELLCQLVAARAVLSDNINYINAINKGGADVWRRYQEWGERKLAEVLSKLERIATIKTKRVYPRD